MRMNKSEAVRNTFEMTCAKFARRKQTKDRLRRVQEIGHKEGDLGPNADRFNAGRPVVYFGVTTQLQPM